MHQWPYVITASSSGIIYGNESAAKDYGARSGGLAEQGAKSCSRRGQRNGSQRSGIASSRRSLRRAVENARQGEVLDQLARTAARQKVIALDTSSTIAFLSGERGRDVSAVEEALRFRQGIFPPVVVTELLSDPAVRLEIGTLIRAVPRLEIIEGYWERAEELRARLLRRDLKAHLADSLIAQ